MTENEVQKWLERFEWDDSEETSDALATICEALQEYPKFKAIGTVTRFEQLSKQFAPHNTDETSCHLRHCNKCDMYRKENEKYHAIGTVEEFKALKEKSVAKIPNYEGGYYGGQIVLNTWICPNCGKDYEVDYDEYEYCPNCGQHIDHSSLTEDD